MPSLIATSTDNRLCFFLSFCMCCSSIDYQTFYILYIVFSRFYSIPHLSPFPGTHTSMLSPLWVGRQCILLLVKHSKSLLQLCSLVASIMWLGCIYAFSLPTPFDEQLAILGGLHGKKEKEASSQQSVRKHSSQSNRPPGTGSCQQSSERSTDSSIQVVG